MQNNDITILVARALMGVLFLMAGLGKLGDPAGFAGFMASGGIPAILAWPAIIFEIVAGAFLIVGFMTRPTAFLLAIFCLVTAFLYHFVPSDQMQMTSFMKNIALTGGYIILGLHGAGGLSLDARRGNTAAA